MSVTFDMLSDFLLNQMRMSHIYQPIMLSQLLENEGRATVTDIASAILRHDPSQVEYYENITRRMPGRVLTNNRNITERTKSTYRLIGFDELSKPEIDKLIEICSKKLSDYLRSNEKWRWDHRRISSGYISGSKKYQVLKDAKSRCLLCGVLEGQRFLTVDHILPRKFGGGDGIDNLQALCNICNSIKNASDNFDLRKVSESYEWREPGCSFCELSAETLALENALCYSIYDLSPVTSGHVLIIPKRHVSDYFDLYQPERNAIQRLLVQQKALLQDSDETITGFNVGFDSGEDAGQTISHCHLDLIPRRKGDCSSGQSGIRGAIPG